MEKNAENALVWSAITRVQILRASKCFCTQQVLEPY